MKKEKNIFLLSLIVCLSLFGCKRNDNDGIFIPEEVKSVIVDHDYIDVTVGDVVNVEKYLYFENAVDENFKVELTKGSLGYAYIDEKNNHIIEFIQEGQIFAKVTTNNNKTATLKFNCYSKLKSKFISYLNTIDYNYAFASIEAIETDNGYTYKTLDNSSTLLSEKYQTVHNDNYFMYSSSSSYGGYLKDGKDNLVYRFECDDIDGSNLNVLPSSSDTAFSNYYFSNKYSIDPSLITTTDNYLTKKEYLYIDLSSSIDLSTKLLTGPIGLINYRKSRISPYFNIKQVVQGDHIIIEFKDVQYKDANNNNIIKEVPVYSIYYKIYLDSNPTNYSMGFAGEYYALINNEDNIFSSSINEYIDSKKIPDKLVDNTMQELISPLLDYNNYSLTVTSRWLDSSYYYLSKDEIPTNSNKEVFPSFAFKNYYTKNKIKEEITYPITSDIKKTYIYSSIIGEDEYVGNYIEDDISYSISYYKKNNEKYLAIFNNNSGMKYEYKLSIELVDNNSFYGQFVSAIDQKNKKYLFIDDNKGAITVKENDEIKTTLSYQGNGIKYYDNINDDLSLSSNLIDKGYLLKDGVIDQENDVLKNRNPLLDLYNNFDSRVDLQRVSTTKTDTGSKISFDMMKVTSLRDVFEKLIDTYPDNNNISKTFLTYYTNTQGTTFNYFSLFSSDIYALKDENDKAYNITLDFTLAYSSMNDVYYHVIFEFNDFDSTTI